MTRDEARSHFTKSGITYADINRNQVANLKDIIQKHLDVRNEVYPDAKMHINKRNKKAIFGKDGSMQGCELTMRCHYFNSREAVTFGTSGFIGFAGWADDTNVAPLLTAFREWVDGLPQAPGSVESKQGLRSREEAHEYTKPIDMVRRKV